jgi:glycosyltransferase involved in cell wall biosynthesis
MGGDVTTRSIVFPIYRNQENIPSLMRAVADFNTKYAGDIEFVFVIDGSPDDSGPILVHELAKTDYQYRIVFHSRNFGSFTAIRTGLEHASGDYVAAMAADLQEPPELIAEFFEILNADRADVVFGQRTGRRDPVLTRMLSHAFWSTYRRLILPSMPSGGVDIFACNRAVLEVILSIQEPNSSLVVQLFWVGFRREFVPYQRRERVHGKSAWSIGRRFRYMMDSILAFSDLPIVLILWIGVLGFLFSVLFATFTVVARLFGQIDTTGYTTLVLLIIAFGSVSLVVQGILGSYLWRAVENTRTRPLRIVSRVVDGKKND